MSVPSVSSCKYTDSWTPVCQAGDTKRLDLIAAADLGWQVIAAGGSTMSSSSYTLLSTTGQPVAGAASGADHTLLSGYWYGFQQFVWTVLLPVVMGSPP
ncbi:protein of unknown function [Candidatus Promineifilum breve]|uniref:Uncharacterized protein n=1 Tax=Candidatus Promineifilum breve TaxID=1806508 RepID=A0A160T7A6_9CHLR|nr:protein of unknown function [Candidatus Promineifilum breve]